MWLGKTSKSLLKVQTRLNLLTRKKFIKLGGLSLNLSKKNITFNTRSNWSFSIFYNNIESNLYVYFFSTVYFFSPPIILKLKDIKVDTQLFLINFLPLFLYQDSTLFFKNVTNVFNTFTRFFFSKLKFKGKGYYIFRSIRNTIAPQFGYSHRIYNYNYTTLVKFLSKTKLIFYTLSINIIFTKANLFKKNRPINVFTGRGVRFTKQLIYKKSGKVASYI